MRIKRLYSIACADTDAMPLYNWRKHVRKIKVCINNQGRLELYCLPCRLQKTIEPYFELSSYSKVELF